MIEVIKPGLWTSIQDGGRFGGLEYGVPISGAMDSLALKQANLILGNDAGAAGLECTLLGPELKFTAPTSIAVSGADMSPTVNDQPFPMLHIQTVQAGDIVKFGSVKSGCRAYLAVKGGIDADIVLDSRSQYEGITESPQLAAGSRVSFKPFDVPVVDAGSRVKADLKRFESPEIEVYPGPEFNKLSVNQKKLLFDVRFSISKLNNRMAYQFNETLENDLSSIITAPVLPGTVQLTPSGKLIALMRDAQTTGGYPRILQLSDRAIDLLSQKFTGHEIRFKLASTL